MKLKVKVNGDGAYVALINPETKEHRKTASVAPGEEVELLLPEVHDENGVEFGDVIASDEGTPAEEQPQGEEASQNDAEAAAETPQGDSDQGEGEETTAAPESEEQTP